MKSWPARVALYVVLASIARWPLLSDPKQYFDGDEALSGVMLLNTLRGEPIPLLPYGAAYGLSIFETLAHVAVAAIAGVSRASMQAAIVTFWLAGVLILERALRRLEGEIAATCATVLLVTMPAWIRPSFASWAYNVSAFFFLACGALAASRIARATGRVTGSWAALGLAFSFAALTQPISAIALAAFAIVIVRRPSLRDGAIAGVAAAAPIALFVAFVRPAHAYWNPPIVGAYDIAGSLLALPQRWFVALSGAYFLATPFRAPSASIVWIVAPIAVIAGARRARNTVTASLAAIVAVSAFTLFVNPEYFGFRYLLPAMTFVAAGAGVMLARVRRDARVIAVVVLSACGLVAGAQMRGLHFAGSGFTDRPTEAEALANLVATLERHNVHYAYTLGDPFLQWKLMFASGGQIAGRWSDPHDRCPEIVQRVDTALQSGRPVAVVVESRNRYVAVPAPPPAVVAQRLAINKPDPKTLAAFPSSCLR